MKNIKVLLHPSTRTNTTSILPTHKLFTFTPTAPASGPRMNITLLLTPRRSGGVVWASKWKKSLDVKGLITFANSFGIKSQQLPGNNKYSHPSSSPGPAARLLWSHFIHISLIHAHFSCAPVFRCKDPENPRKEFILFRTHSPSVYLSIGAFLLKESLPPRLRQA